MKIVYIINKGLKCYPPCLTQVLYLHDLGYEIVVIHGLDSQLINDELDRRGIEHYVLKSDAEIRTRSQSALHFLQYNLEAYKYLRKVNKNDLIWFGNAESALFLADKVKSRFILTLLELYEQKNLYDRRLSKFINKAAAVICCEKHRAAIVRELYQLKDNPYVVPNKSYDLSFPSDSRLKEQADKFLQKKVIIYQGIIAPDRPIDVIADALSTINKEIYFFVIGKCDAETKNNLLSKYSKIVFWDYIPAPQHLQITQYANIGIANYSKRPLNNYYCAPNKIYEYAKYGIPMLISDNPGLTETVGKAGAAITVDFNNISDVALGIEKIYEDYSSMSDLALEFYNGTDIDALYREIISDVVARSDE